MCIAVEVFHVEGDIFGSSRLHFVRQRLSIAVQSTVINCFLFLFVYCSFIQLNQSAINLISMLTSCKCLSPIITVGDGKIRMENLNGKKNIIFPFLWADCSINTDMDIDAGEEHFSPDNMTANWHLNRFNSECAMCKSKTDIFSIIMVSLPLFCTYTYGHDHLQCRFKMNIGHRRIGFWVRWNLSHDLRRFIEWIGWCWNS